MQSAQIIIINGTLREIGAFLLLSRRAHLLTTAKTRRVLVSGGISTFVETVRSPRVAAPLEPCESCLRASPSVRLPVRQPHFLFMKKKQKFCPKGVIYKNGDLSFRSKSHQSQLR